MLGIEWKRYRKTIRFPLSHIYNYSGRHLKAGFSHGTPGALWRWNDYGLFRYRSWLASFFPYGRCMCGWLPHDQKLGYGDYIYPLITALGISPYIFNRSDGESRACGRLTNNNYMSKGWLLTLCPLSLRDRTNLGCYL